jgi:hypothetical protein
MLMGHGLNWTEGTTVVNNKQGLIHAPASDIAWLRLRVSGVECAPFIIGLVLRRPAGGG